MERKTLYSGIAIVLGMICLASFSIRHNRFYSGICGIVGCLLIVGGFIALHWDKMKEGDQRIKRTVRLLIALCIVLVVLNVIAELLQ